MQRQVMWMGALGLALQLANGCAADFGATSAGANATEDRRFVAYTASFGERLKLPRQEHTIPEGGLQAVEIAISRESGSDLPRCFTRFYIDAALDIADDFGMESSADLLEPKNHFFLRPRPDGRDPRELFDRAVAESLLQRQARYFIQLRFTTGDFSEGKSGAEDSAPIREQVRNLLPGIHYIGTTACVPSRLIRRGTGVDLGIRRRGAPNLALQRGPLEDENFVRVRLPSALLADALPSLALFEKQLQEAVEALNRKRRPSRKQERSKE